MIGLTTFNHRLAVAMFLIFTAGYFGSAFLFGLDELPTQLLWILSWTFAVLVAFVISLVALFNGNTRATGWRGAGDRLDPLVALAAALAVSHVTSAVLARADRMEFARAHSGELSGMSPRAVIYSEGIPDGGTAIVRLPGYNPEALPQRTMVRLAGERIKDCQPLDERDWFCTFDRAA